MITRLLSLAQRMSYERGVKINEIKEDIFFSSTHREKKTVKRAYNRHYK